MIAVPTMPFVACSGAALVASPSSALREQVMHRLQGRCRLVHQVHGGADALAKLEKGEYQVLFLDRHLPDLDVEEVRGIIERRFRGITVVLLDSDSTVAAGAEKEEVENEYEAVPHLVRADLTPDRLDMTRKAVGSTAAEPLPGMIGSSEGMQKVYRMVHLVAARPITVLIAGPTGTGKELIARALHTLSNRSSKPFVVVNCAAIPEALLESELFGYSRGAFTGAVQSQLGRISAAQGGTLFLDEVSELPLGMQAKILRFLEQKEIQRLGTSEVTRVDVRVVAASNVDLGSRALRAEFRQDLFFRLAAFPIELPPLVERRSDIVPLAEHFLDCMAAAMQTKAPRLSEEVVRILEAHSWGGNVRELQHVMERASILAEGRESVEAEHLLFSYSKLCGSEQRAAS